MSNNGWISLHRKIQDSAIYSDSQAVHLWIHLLLKANHQDKEFLFNGSIQTVKRGQLLTGRKALSSETGINESKIQRLLKTFEMCHMIEQQANNKSRLISITNYDNHQLGEQQTNSKRTADEQQMNTNNNVNKDNKVNKDKPSSAKADPIPYIKIAELWNNTATNLPRIGKPESMSADRKKLIKRFWNAHRGNFEEGKAGAYFANYFAVANRTDFWVDTQATIDTLMRPGKYENIIKG